MSKKPLPIEEKKPVQYDEIRKEIAREEMLTRMKVDGMLRDFIDKEIEVEDIEVADRGVIITGKIMETGQKMRLWTNSSTVIKEMPRIQKALGKYGHIIIVPKLKQSKTGRTYLVI